MSHIGINGLPVAKWCLYYPRGVRLGEPLPALVFRNQGGGLLDLRVQRWGDQQGHQGIRHVDDPYFIERPELRAKLGAWDFCDGEAPDKAPEMDAGEPLDNHQVREEVVNQARAGRNPAQIASNLSTKGLTAAKIDAFLRDYHAKHAKPVGA